MAAGTQQTTQQVKQQITAAEFDALAQLPEHADRRLEFVGGEIIEVVSNHYSSAVAALVLAEIVVFVRRHKLGTVTGADGGYVVGGERYIPDVGFIAKTRQPAPSRDAYNPAAPDLAVEVLSPTDEAGNVRLKLTNYLAAGTTVWVVDPERRTVEVHTPGQPSRRIAEDATVEGGDLLPGFALAVAGIFPPEEEAEGSE